MRIGWSLSSPRWLAIKLGHRRVADLLQLVPDARGGRGDVHDAAQVDRRADHDQFGSPRVDLRDLVAQLRDLLTAEQSAEVSDEDEDDRLLRPKGAEPYSLSPPVGELDACELGGYSHRESSSITSEEDLG